MWNSSICKALFCHLLTVTWLWLNIRGTNGCIPPSEEVHTFQGIEGENVVQLYLETAGFWSCTVLDEASGADMSFYFKTIMLNDSHPLVRVIRVVKSLPSTGRHSFRILQITCHCTVDGASKAFYRKAMLRAQRPDALQNVHSLVEFSVSKCTKKKSVIRELHRDFMAGDTELVFKVMREGTINVAELSMFQVTRNGVVTVSGSLDEHGGHTYLLMLKLIKPDNTSAIVPVAIHVFEEFQNSTFDDGSISTVRSTLPAPRFVNTNCPSPQECYVRVYSSEIPKHHKGKIFNLIPCEIQVEEAYKETVSYLLVGGNPSSYLDMFTINSANGDLYTLHLDLLNYSQSFFIIVQARSNNPGHQHHESALVYVHVLVEDEAVKTAQTTATLGATSRGTLSQTTTESLMPTTEAIIQTTKKAMMSRKGQIKPTAKKSRPPTQGKTTPGTRSRKGKSSLLDTTEDQSLVDWMMNAEMAAFDREPKSTFSSSESSSKTEEIRLDDVVPERLMVVNSCASFRSLSLMNILANVLNTAALLINTLTVLCLIHVLCILHANNILI